MKITICGSMVFLEAMKLIKDDLIAQGHQVKLPVWSENDEESLRVQKKFFEYKEGGKWEDWMSEYKGRAIREHFDKITWAEAILVVNKEKNGISGYIGGNTLIEIGLAFYLKKPIILLYQVPEVSYRDEILGMQPWLIDGELTRIPSSLPSV